MSAEKFRNTADIDRDTVIEVLRPPVHMVIRDYRVLGARLERRVIPTPAQIVTALAAVTGPVPARNYQPIPAAFAAA